jgi:hypothetical protein
MTELQDINYSTVGARRGKTDVNNWMWQSSLFFASNLFKKKGEHTGSPLPFWRWIRLIQMMSATRTGPATAAAASAAEPAFRPLGEGHEQGHLALGLAACAVRALSRIIARADVPAQFEFRSALFTLILV